MATMADVTRTVGAMAQVYGRAMSNEAAAIFASDLEGHNPDALMDALSRCRKELRYFPTLADILDRVQAADGRPGAEEAWAMIPKDEDASVVWTCEMAAAFGIARPLLREGDHVAARLAFKEAYLRELSTARQEKRPVKWEPSLGFEKAGREAAIRQAVDAGRMSVANARTVLPELEITGTVPAALLKGPTEIANAHAQENARRIREMISGASKSMPGEQ